MSDFYDVYEMTPMQAGMLFQSLYAPEAKAYLQQYWGRLDGNLDVAGFRAAWQAVTDRHDILRAQCHWEDLDRPAFVIHQSAAPDWQLEDWSDLAPSTADTRLKEWLDADRARGFTMDQVPLMRFALIRTGAQSHTFVWTFHHLLLDGWCGAVLVREVLDLYGGAAPKPPAASFKTYADWLAAQDPSAAGVYWTRTLAGADLPSPLGVDRADTGETGQAEHRFVLDPALSQGLNEMARRSRLTLATLMQGAWALVLSRYSGRADLTFGTVLSGRPSDLPGVEDMVGLFLNTVPVRVTISPDQPVTEWLAAIQSDHRTREEHGYVAMAQLQGWAGLSGSVPLFDSLLIVETYPESIDAAVRRQGADLRLSETGIYEKTNFPLVVKVLPGKELEICLSADCVHVPSAALPRLADHLAEVLKAFLSDTVATTDDIDILTPHERSDLALVNRGRDRDLPPPVPHQLLALAEGAPNAPALETTDGALLSRAALMARAAVIAGALLRRGIGRGDVIAVCQDRTPDLVATLIAIWRCGAAYLPLDPIYPAERIAYILDHAGATAAVADATGARAIGDAALPVVLVEECGGAAPTTFPDVVGADDLAYLLYTSGSTGKPKGVPITHGALANLLGSVSEVPGLSSQDRLLATTTVAFDIAALELFGPLVVGGTVVLAPSGASIDGAGLARTMTERKISVMQATPAGWRVLRDSGWAGHPGLKMLCGGEALDRSLAQDLLTLGGELWNMYGPTETAIWSGALKVTDELLGGPRVPVGGALANTTLTLRDAAGRLVPEGVIAELWIGGAGLSPGYLNRADLTEDRFVTVNGERLYRTGDQMRLAADGTLDFVGRLDDQVKLRGYRIELGEVEAHLERCPGVAQAIASIHGDGGSAELIAHVRCEGPIPSPAALRLHLSGGLPLYMIPSSFVVVEDFPLTPNGKIDRKALAKPESAQRGLPRTLDPDQRVAVVAGVWAEALGVGEVGPGDDFFALGGHSLAALRVVAGVRQALGVDLSLRDLFDAPDFLSFCARTTDAGSGVALPSPVPSADPPRLSAAQHRLWLLSRLDPDRRDYHLCLAVRIKGPLETEPLERSLAQMAARHDVLRCRFPAVTGVAEVEVLDRTDTPLHLDDLRGMPEVERGAKLDAIRQHETRSPFEMESAPPWRVRLVALADDDHVLFLTLHHILADEWSFALILDELRDAYAGATACPRPGIQYPDFAAWQGALDLDAQRSFWARQLGGAPAVVSLPADRPRPPNREGRAGRVALSLGPQATESLENLARSEGATLYICLLAAYATFLHRHSGETDLLIATPVSNRRLPDFQGLIGLFVNTLAIRADLSDEPDFATLLLRLRNTVLGAHDNQDLPFEQVIDLMETPRNLRHAPLVQTMFSMPQFPRSGRLATDLGWEAIPANEGRARFDLSLELERGPEGLSGHFDYATDMFDEATVKRLARRMERLLEGLAEAAYLPLSDLPLLTSEDSDLAAPRRAGRAGIDGGPLKWLEGLALQRPSAQAFIGSEMTYRQLWREVSAKAVALRSSGAGPGVPVSIGGAGRAGVIATLAVWQAGGTAVQDSGTDADPDAMPGVVSHGSLPPDEPHPQVQLQIGGRTVLRSANGAALLFDSRLLAHFVQLAGPVSPEARVACPARILSADGLAAMAIALFAGVPLDVGRLAEGVGIQTGNKGRLIRFGGVGPDEFPASFSLDDGLFTPATGVLLRVLDDFGQIVPPGCLGRVAVGGQGLARGYVGDPAGSALRFVPDRHILPQDLDGASPCLFLTDLCGRVGLDGRIWLAEWPQPVTRLRESLPAEAVRREHEGKGHRAPLGETENALAELWAATLGVARPGRDDSFFELGGNSVLAIQLTARAADAGLSFEPRELFEHQTIAALARVAKAAAPVQRPAARDAFDPVDLEALSELVSFGEDR